MLHNLWNICIACPNARKKSNFKNDFITESTKALKKQKVLNCNFISNKSTSLILTPLCRKWILNDWNSPPSPSAVISKCQLVKAIYFAEENIPRSLRQCDGAWSNILRRILPSKAVTNLIYYSQYLEYEYFWWIPTIIKLLNTIITQ